MRHHIFEQADHYPIALLCKATSFNKTELIDTYINGLIYRGVQTNEIIAFTLKYNEANKAPATLIKEYLNKLLSALDNLNTKYLYVADANYFKVLTSQAKAEPHFGYCLPCKIKGYEHMHVVLGVSYQSLIYNPALSDKLQLSLTTLVDAYKGNYRAIGTGIIHSAQYPETCNEIALVLHELHKHPRLAVDIEGFSLKFNEAGIGTISFAWDEHNGVAFPVDCLENNKQNVRNLLRVFFSGYEGELVFHNAPYDVKCLIAALWMKDLLDTEGMLIGLDTLCKRMHDTKIIAYLATNSTAGNQLSLKHLAHEFAGNWAIAEIKDIRQIPLAKLLQYNLVDTLSTQYVYKKYMPIMEADNQGDLYRGLFLASLKLIIQLELTGMPMSKSRIQAVKAELKQIEQKQLDLVNNSSVVQQLNKRLQVEAMTAANAKLKLKQHPLEKFANVVFNINSVPQLQKLLYQEMGLPVIDYTDTRQPATGAETLEKLINHCTDAVNQSILTALIEYSQVNKLLGTFIAAFEEALSKDDSDIVWLHGLFNLGGTVSGRLSSSDPNLQNLPAGIRGNDFKRYLGKLIKSCFVSPSGYLYCGADFNSLEDYISALTTKDKNKLRVYEEGFDGHCLRAAYYFRDQIPDIDLENPQSVNSLKKTRPDLRQDSKSPTFLLTYGGTYHGLMNSFGWSEEKAKTIEANYHMLYKESDEYVKRKLEQASKDGFVTVAFGLRVRTPLLKQVVFGSPKMPYEAAAEGRTAGNALGQSYGLLNNRAAVAFFQKVWASPYRHDIKPVGLIHDAIYILVRDQAEIVRWANEHLIKEMQWQELPEIQHPTVKLGAALDIFWPNWTYPTTLPNNISLTNLIEFCSKAKAELTT